MRFLMIQFSDGNSYFGSFRLYRLKQIDYSFAVNNTRSMMSHEFEYIKHEHCDFIYTKSSIVKFLDVTESEYNQYVRDNRIQTVLSDTTH